MKRLLSIVLSMFVAGLVFCDPGWCEEEEHGKAQGLAGTVAQVEEAVKENALLGACWRESPSAGR